MRTHGVIQASGVFPASGGSRARCGFTMVELMLVIGIIVVALGILAPSLNEFFANRELDGVTGQFGSVFSTARLQAVQRRRDVSVVFFREGPRVFDELSRQFTDDETWNPEQSTLAKDPPRMWYALGFARAASSYDPGYDQEDYKPSADRHIPPWGWWEERFGNREDGSESSSRRGRGRSEPTKPLDTSMLYRVTFRRDGTLIFGLGCSDVPTTYFNEVGKLTADRSGDPISDVVILQLDQTAAGFLDLRSTGQFKSAIGMLNDAPSALGDVRRIRSDGGEHDKKRRS